jgi:hypothetical protein
MSEDWLTDMSDYQADAGACLPSGVRERCDEAIYRVGW